jgi:hypothetical protein
MVELDWARELVRDQSPYFEITQDGKHVKCLLNYHEFPLNREIVETFIRCVACLAVFHAVHDE